MKVVAAERDTFFGTMRNVLDAETAFRFFLLVSNCCHRQLK